MSAGERNDHPSPSSDAECESRASAPRRRSRTFTTRDHLCIAVTALLALTSGLLALAGHPWWAVPAALCALGLAHQWSTRTLFRPHGARASEFFGVSVFAVWLLLPIWRGLVHSETAPFPEALLLAGLAPAACIALYAALLIRR